MDSSYSKSQAILDCDDSDMDAILAEFAKEEEKKEKLILIVSDSEDEISNILDSYQELDSPCSENESPEGVILSSDDAEMECLIEEFCMESASMSSEQNASNDKIQIASSDIQPNCSIKKNGIVNAADNVITVNENKCANTCQKGIKNETISATSAKILNLGKNDVTVDKNSCLGAKETPVNMQNSASSMPLSVSSTEESQFVQQSSDDEMECLIEEFCMEIASMPSEQNTSNDKIRTDIQPNCSIKENGVYAIDNSIILNENKCTNVCQKGIKNETISATSAEILNLGKYDVTVNKKSFLGAKETTPVKMQNSASSMSLSVSSTEMSKLHLDYEVSEKENFSYNKDKLINCANSISISSNELNSDKNFCKTDARRFSEEKISELMKTISKPNENVQCLKTTATEKSNCDNVISNKIVQKLKDNVNESVSESDFSNSTSNIIDTSVPLESNKDTSGEENLTNKNSASEKNSKITSTKEGCCSDQQLSAFDMSEKTYFEENLSVSEVTGKYYDQTQSILQNSSHLLLVQKDIANSEYEKEAIENMSEGSLESESIVMGMETAHNVSPERNISDGTNIVSSNQISEDSKCNLLVISKRRLETLDSEFSNKKLKIDSQNNVLTHQRSSDTCNGFKSPNLLGNDVSVIDYKAIDKVNELLPWNYSASIATNEKILDSIAVFICHEVVKEFYGKQVNERERGVKKLKEQIDYYSENLENIHVQATILQSQQKKAFDSRSYIKPGLRTVGVSAKVVKKQNLGKGDKNRQISEDDSSKNVLQERENRQKTEEESSKNILEEKTRRRTAELGGSKSILQERETEKKTEKQERKQKGLQKLKRKLNKKSAKQAKSNTLQKSKTEVENAPQNPNVSKEETSPIIPETGASVNLLVDSSVPRSIQIKNCLVGQPVTSSIPARIKPPNVVMSGNHLIPYHSLSKPVSPPTNSVLLVPTTSSATLPKVNQLASIKKKQPLQNTTMPKGSSMAKNVPTKAPIMSACLQQSQGQHKHLSSPLVLSKPSEKNPLECYSHRPLLLVKPSTSTPSVPLHSLISSSRESPATFVQQNPAASVQLNSISSQTPRASVQNNTKLLHQYPYLPSDAIIDDKGRHILPKPDVKAAIKDDGSVVICWNVTVLAHHSKITSYQIYSCQEKKPSVGPPIWKIIGNVAAMKLPMSCTLEQFEDKARYYITIRVVDVLNRYGPFSNPVVINYIKRNDSLMK